MPLTARAAGEVSTGAWSLPTRKAAAGFAGHSSRVRLPAVARQVYDAKQCRGNPMTRRLCAPADGGKRTASMQITQAHIDAAYEAARRVHANAISVRAAVAVLRDTHGLNEVSAQHFVNNFQLMLGGRLYQRTMSALATQRFLEGIQRDFGPLVLINALGAVSRHVDYYSRKTRNPQAQIRAIIRRMSRDQFAMGTLEEYTDNLQTGVQASLSDTNAAREKRLKKASPTPTVRYVLAKVFSRNRDVVAAALVRANGICECCKLKAPFTRASSGRPYLEVHHRVQLAHGGEDTPENAIAICPNCHRNLHFGAGNV